MATPPDFSVGQVLTAAQMNAVGLWLIESKDVTSGTLVQFDNKFTTDYDTYLLDVNYLQNTLQGGLNFTLQDVNNASVANNYDLGVGGAFLNSGTPTFASFNNLSAQASVQVGTAIAGEYLSFQMTIQGPRRAVKTLGSLAIQTDNWSATWTNVFVNGGWSHTLATAYYGCRLTSTAGTITGRFSLYGMNK